MSFKPHSLVININHISLRLLLGAMNLLLPLLPDHLVSPFELSYGDHMLCSCMSISRISVTDGRHQAAVSVPACTGYKVVFAKLTCGWAFYPALV